jgi:hypothetical protein
MRRLLVLILLLAAALTTLAWLVLDSQPRVEPGDRIRRADLVWAKQLFERNVPPSRAANTLQTLDLSEEEVNRLLNYAVVVKPVTGISANLEPGWAEINLTLRVRKNPFGHYLNFSADLSNEENRLTITRMRLGGLPLPAFLGRGVWWIAQNWLQQDASLATLLNAVQRVDMHEDRLSLDYQWHPKLLTMLERKGAEVLVGPEEKERLLAYAGFVRKTTNRYPNHSQQPARELVSNVFLYARQRGGDPAAENRAALTALGAYVAGVSLPQLLEGKGRTTRRAPPVLLKLHGRRDAAEHLLISAALSAAGGSRLANAIGLAKEEEDIESGSGFSFTDLAYDRAGARLGELATGAAANSVQAALRQLADDAALSPSFADMPEFLPHQEFVRRFDKPGSLAYQRQIEEIDRRLAGHPLYGR